MQQEQKVKGGIVVHRRTELYKFGVGTEMATYTYVEGTYTGDIDGPAAETFVAVDHVDGSQSHYGFGAFTGKVKGRSGTLTWKFRGKPGTGEIEILGGTGELSALKGAVVYTIKEESKTEFTYSGALR